MTKNKKTQLLGAAMLLLTAFIWGSSFVSQSVGMQNVQAFTFNGIRTLIGAAVLLPVVYFRNRSAHAEYRLFNRKTLARGVIIGLVFCAASNFQQFAFYYSTSGKIAFITALYMFFVPLLGLFLKKRVALLTWICVFIGFVGLYFLCIDPAAAGTVNLGDILSFICAILFAVHILLIEKLAPDVDGVGLSCMQFIVSGVISCLLMFVFETPQIGEISNATLPLLYSGVLSCGVAYTFQIIGQKYTEATVASLLLCTESVFGVLCGAIVLNELLSGREIAGCVIMFIAIILSQLSERLSAGIKKLR